jgi:hypothetical protein
MAVALKRLPGWPSRLHAAIDGHRRHPFQFGSHDCCILAADGVQAITGVDLAGSSRGTYDSAEGAMRRLREAGYRDQIELAAAQFEEIHISRARTGDLAAVSTGESWGLALGIVNGATITVFAPKGVGSVPLLGGPGEERRAFKVG